VSTNGRDIPGAPNDKVNGGKWFLAASLRGSGVYHPAHGQDHAQVVDGRWRLIMPVLGVPGIRRPHQVPCRLQATHERGVDLGKANIMVLGKLLNG
jgi:hypothetical protein